MTELFEFGSRNVLQGSGQVAFPGQDGMKQPPMPRCQATPPHCPLPPLPSSHFLAVSMASCLVHSWTLEPCRVRGQVAVSGLTSAFLVEFFFFIVVVVVVFGLLTLFIYGLLTLKGWSETPIFLVKRRHRSSGPICPVPLEAQAALRPASSCSGSKRRSATLNPAALSQAPS